VTSKGGAKQQVTLYYMSQHFGICTTVDALRRITINEKVAWEGRVTSQGSFTIDKSDLFGGPTEQGGVKGTVYYLPGAAAQVLPDNLAQKLGRANGADCPGYRGLTSVFMTGPSDGQAGFYWTANDPYLPGVWIKVERAPVGLSPGYAMVPRPGVGTTPVESIAVGATLIGAQFSPDHQYFYAISSSFMAIDLRTRSVATYVASLDHGIGSNVPYAVTPSGIIGTGDGTQIIGIGFDGSSSVLTGSMPGARGVFYAGGQVVLLPSSFAGMNFGLYAGGAVATCPTNYFPSDAFTDVDGNGIAVGGNGSAHELYVGPILENGDLINTTAYGSSGDAYGFDNGTHLVVVQGAYRYLVTKTRPHTIITGIGSTASNDELIANFEAITPGSSAFWMGLSEYRSDDLSLIRTIDFTSWPASGHSEANGYFYDWYNNGFITGGLFSDPVVVWRDLDRGEADANPAHIIYECLTNTDWGMGSPSSLIDVTSFENAGVELFNEPLGLSMIWTKQATIQDFVQEVLDHIQATLFVDPQSGLLTLKLIRGDYDVDTLPTISPSTANLSNFGRKLWGDIVNRSYWALRPASVLRVDWPQYGLDGVVMRLTSIDYGKPGDPTIKASLIEDVFGLDVADYVAPPSTLWTNPSADPTAMTQQVALTLPYFLAAQGITTVTGAAYPEVLAGVLGASSNADTFGYELWGEVTLADGSTEWQALASLNLVGYAELSANLAAEATSTGVAFTGFVGSATPVRNGLAIIGSGTEAQNELALITVASTTYTLSRGVLDTVPRAWTAGTPVWFVTTDDLIEDPNARSVGEVVSYRLRTRTSKGLLSLYAAPALTATLSDRPWQPLRPANVKAYATAFSSVSAPIDATGRPNPWVTVTWANRDRLTEDSQVLAWTDSTVTPETGQTTVIAVLKPDATTVLATHSGLTGTSFNVPDASFGSEPLVILRTSSERTDADGTFESLQSFDHWVTVGFVSGVDGATGQATASFVGGSHAGTSLAASGAGAAALAGRAIAAGSMSASGAASTSLVGTTPATFLVGNNGAATTNTAISGDIQVGVCAIAAASGTANNLVITGSSASANPSLVYRLCIYAATGTTTWGALLGKTADITGLGLNEVKSVPLISPVSITSGQFYAVTVQFDTGSGGGSASNGAYADLGFGDTFSDGPVNPASAPGTNSPNGRIIYATT
jgi:hypothetical protein